MLSGPLQGGVCERFGGMYRVRFDLFIALRYLFSKREQKFISVISWTAVLGVALGVGALVVVMGVMNGFTTDLRDKIIGATSHAIVFDGAGHVYPTDELMDAIRSVDGVVGATPFIYSELMVSSSSGGKGVVLRGIDPSSAIGTIGVLDKIVEGSARDLDASGPVPGIIVGIDLAKRLALNVGSRVNMIAPSGQSTSAGYTPKVQAFRVVGIFSLGMFEYDSSLAFVSLPVARSVLGWGNGAVSGIEIAMNDPNQAEVIGAKIIDTIGGTYYIQTWMRMNANLFAALELEKTAMAVILFLVVVVGAFSIITSLVMLVMEKTRDIAILMSLGAKRVTIRSIFVIEGLLIGFLGTSLGYALGLTACWLLKKYRFIKLPKGVYSLDYLPVLLETADLVIIGVSAMIICFLATLYPARKASHLEPVSALRHE